MKMPESSETRLILLIRRIPSRWVAKLPWVVIAIQCLAIVLLLLDPVRQGTCSSITKESCICQEDIRSYQSHGIEQVAASGSRDHGSTSEVSDEYSFISQKDAVLIKGPLLSLLVPRHPPRVFFNRVPKCGSSTVMDLVTEMVNVNNITFGRAKEYMRFYLDDFWMEKFVNRIELYPTPLIYERHIHYFQTVKFGLPQPVFINIIRDPLERMVSWYYFRRYQDGHVRDLPTEQRVRTFDECVLGNHSECMEPGGDYPEEGYFKMIPFFCGQDDFCREPSQSALSQAIHNVKEHFLVVGLTEEFSEFVEVLEFLLPDFFQGASHVYHRLEVEWQMRHKTTYKLPVSPEVRRIMQDRLIMEYNFYIFARKRFHRILNAVRAAKRKLDT